LQGRAATTKLATIKLENLGNVKFFCGVQNDHKYVIKMKNKLQFEKFIVAIAVAEVKEAADAQKDA
jgi:hypothetical protein